VNTMMNMREHELEDYKAKVLGELIEYAGSVKHLSLMLDVRYTAIRAWEKQGYITGQGVTKVEQNPVLAEKFTLKYMRPDLFIQKGSNQLERFHEDEEL